MSNNPIRIGAAGNQAATVLSALVSSETPVEIILDLYAELTEGFVSVMDGLEAAAAPTTPAPQVAPQAAAVSPEQIAQEFNATTLTVKGTQHGELPEWVFDAAKKFGVTEIWDNRDGLATNAKRPWFKAADGTTNAKGDPIAFWPPR